MKYILFIALLISQSAFSQKKDKFSIYDLDKQFHFIDSVGKWMPDDSIAAYVVKNYNFKSPHKAQHPDSQKLQYTTYEFHFKDNTSLYLLVTPDLTIQEISYHFNPRERSIDFISWNYGSGKLNTGTWTK